VLPEIDLRKRREDVPSEEGGFFPPPYDTRKESKIDLSSVIPPGGDVNPWPGVGREKRKKVFWSIFRHKSAFKDLT
jgi:hypothetical protein